MPRFFDPPDSHPPSPSYRHGVIHGLAGRRLVASGQVGVRPDGTVAGDFAAQCAQCFDNLFAVMRAGGMEPTDIVKMVVYVTIPDAIADYRKVRAAKLGEHVCTSTYLQIAGLARPELLVEIEAEAVRED